MNKYKRINITKSQAEDILEIIYLFVFAVFVGYFFLRTTTFIYELPEYFYYNVRTILLALLMTRISLSERYDLKETFFLIALIITFLFAWRRNEYEELLNLLILMVGAKGISFRRILKVYLFATGGLLLYTMFASLTGITENLVYYQEGRRTRQSFGIIYPTDFSAHVFYSVISWLYLRSKKITYFELGIVVGIAGFVYWFCDARLNTITLLLTAGIFLVYKLTLNRQKQESALKEFITSLFALSTTLCAAIMIGLTMLYSPENKFMVFLDNVLNNRLRLGKKGIDVFGFSVWGRYIQLYGMGGSTNEPKYYFFMDCSYLFMILQYGLIIMGVFLCIWLFIGVRAKNEDDIPMLLVIGIIAVQCMVEHHMTDIAYNPFLLAALSYTGIAAKHSGNISYKIGMLTKKIQGKRTGVIG